MEDQAVRALAARFFDAIEAGDVDTVAACYADDIGVWHNFDGLTQTKDENLATLRGLVKGVSDRSYADRRLDVFPGGFVQQHVLHGTRRDGQRVSLPAALIARLRDGKIVRIEEYIDSAHVAAFTGRA